MGSIPALPGSMLPKAICGEVTEQWEVAIERDRQWLSPGRLRRCSGFARAVDGGERLVNAVRIVLRERSPK
jgi:hypothetical protein